MLCPNGICVLPVQGTADDVPAEAPASEGLHGTSSGARWVSENQDPDAVSYAPPKGPKFQV